jgi:hypothetical protein
MNVRQEVFRGVYCRVADVNPSSVSEETKFAHIRQEAKIMIARPLAEFPLGENTLAVPFIQTQCLVNETSSRSEHCFERQRARLGCSKVVVEHIHDAVDEILG